MALDKAHKGYEYQDLFTAVRLVDVLLQRVAELEVDQKLFTDDILDDLTTSWADGSRIRQQLKHSDSPSPFTEKVLTTQDKDCRLDDLIFSAVTDEQQIAKKTEYRLLVSATYSKAEAVSEYLISADDTVTSFADIPTRRFRLNADKIWPVGAEPEKEWKRVIGLIEQKPLTRENFVWFAANFVIELEMPGASLDLTSPGNLEKLLLNRLTNEIGAGAYPNENRSALDVAAQLIAAARAARAHTDDTKRETLLRRTQLRDDYGQVARAYPIDAGSEIELRPTLDAFTTKVDAAIKSSVPLVVTGPPGQGKTWASDRMSRILQDAGWLVAGHYCYLNGAEDEHRSKRVKTEAIIGSLMAQLAELEPGCVDELRPRYAVSTEMLISTLNKIRAKNPKQQIALFVDGVDHITRILPTNVGGTDPATDLAKELVRMGIPEGVLLIVACQPGSHEVPFREVGAKFYELPGWGQQEVRALGEKLGVIASDSAQPGEYIIARDDQNLDKLVVSLTDKAKGNALYATYCYRELKQSYGTGATAWDACQTVKAIPSFDGTMQSYYTYLMKPIPSKSIDAAELLAILEFAVTREELKVIHPLIAKYIDPMITQLSPVLVERSQQGGIRVYHESFQRFLLETRLTDTAHKQAIIAPVIDWLSNKGFMQDARTFRFLPALLLEAGRISEISALIPLDFGMQAIAACHSEAAIMKNMSVAAEAAVQLNDWEALVRYSEQSKGISTYFYERVDSIMQNFSDIPIALFGADWLAQRLIFEGRTVLPAYLGLHLCEDIDQAGAVAPWKEYLEAYGASTVDDDPYYGRERPKNITRAEIRGQLRLIARDELDAESLKDWLNQPGLPHPDDITEIMLDVYGSGKLVLEVVDKLPEKRRSAYLLALAKKYERVKDEEGIPSQESLTEQAVRLGLWPSQTVRALNLGANPTLFSLDDNELIDQTKAVINRDARWDETQLTKWIALVFVAAYKNSSTLDAVQLLVQGAGWYRDWLGYVIDLARYKATPTESILPIFNQLTTEKNPFTGTPRACDLYSIHSLIAATLRLGLDHIEDSEWERVLNMLREVREHTTSSLQGSISGPLSPALLFELVIEYTSPARKAITDNFMSQFFTDTLESSVYYDDIAEHHLRQARLLLASGDRTGAQKHWEQAARFNICNGHRKDVTVYELLDSMTSLITFNRQEARSRIARVKVLVERVLMHTDLKETRHALPRWWDLVTRADGVAAGNLIAEQMLATPNRHAWRLKQASFKLYEAQSHRLSPELRFAARIGLGYNATLNSSDAALLTTLEDTGASFIPLHLASDEITSATQDRVTDDHDEEKYDHAGTTLLAETAQKLNGHSLEVDGPPYEKTEERFPRPENIAGRINAQLSIDWGQTPIEVERAIRRWSQRSYDIYRTDSAVRSSQDELVNAVGWRLLSFCQAGRKDVAENILRFLGEHIGYSNPSYVLGCLAEGLERNGVTNLAVTAYILAYTKTRGDGWRTFGGSEYEHLLKAGIRLNADLALKELGSAMTHVISSEYYGVQGISQGLISAFTSVSMPEYVSAGPLDLWDATMSIIEQRLPRVGEADDDTDPLIPTPAEIDTDELLEGAIATAVISAIAHPERNLKRRALMGTLWLIKLKQNIASNGIEKVLRSKLDPGGKSWLLWVMTNYETAPYPITVHCKEILTDLAKSDLLTVRTLARKLLIRASLPAPTIPATRPKTLPPTLPSTDQRIAGSYYAANMEMKRCAKERILDAQELYPQLGDDTDAILGSIFNDAEFKASYRRQVEGMNHVTAKRAPDAYTKEQEAVEQTLQEVAAGARVAVAKAGEVITHPAAFEAELAERILDNPELPLRFEASRIPRPARLEETLTVNSMVPAPTIKDGPYKGWVVTGTYEADVIPPNRYKKIERKVTFYEGGLESSLKGSSHAHPSVFGYGNGQVWLHELPDDQPGKLLSSFKGPLTGVEFGTLPKFYGLGSADPLLTPNTKLVYTLGLRPGPVEHGFNLIDKDGAVGIVARTWRTNYIEGQDYDPAYPLIEGMDILIRPDLLATFEGKVKPQLLRFCSRQH